MATTPLPSSIQVPASRSKYHAGILAPGTGRRAGSGCSVQVAGSGSVTATITDTTAVAAGKGELPDAGQAVFGLSESRLRRSVAEIVQAIGLPWSPHDLRRGFVTTAQRTLNDLATVKRLVNHAAGGDVTTKHYLRLSVEDLRTPMQRIEEAFMGLWKMQ